MPEELMERLLGYEIQLPGQLARQITTFYAFERSMPLSNLEIDEGHCCWCNATHIPTKMHRYCGHLCRDSAYVFCYPQSPTSKGYHIMKQSWSCMICGLLYEDDAMKAIRHRLDLRKTIKEKWAQEITMMGLFYTIGYRISREMDMDHIRPIYKGGVGIGIRNHQVICRPCHHRKTASER